LEEWDSLSDPLELWSQEASQPHLVVPCTIGSPNENRFLKSNALIDCGGSGFTFIDQAFASSLSLTTFPLPYPRPLRMFNGEAPEDSIVTDVAWARLQIGRHHENTYFYLTRLPQTPIVLGIPWLRKHNPNIDWSLDLVTFKSSHCRSNCLEDRQPSKAYGNHSPQNHRPENHRPENHRPENHRPENHRPENHRPENHSPENHRPENYSPENHSPEKPGPSSVPAQPLDIYFVNAASLYTAHRRAQKTEEPLDLCRVTLNDIEKAIAKIESPKDTLDPRSIVPSEYHDLLDVFRAELADVLPPHRAHDHKIELMEGKEPPSYPLRRYSQEELRLIHIWLKDNLAKRFIQPSTSAAAAPILLARKPGGGVRICVDYRGLNEITKKNRYPIPLIQETLQLLTKARYFTKLDLIAAFNKLRIAMGEEWKTAFRTRWGLFESLVMPFGLTNAPASWQNYINDVLRDFLDEFVCAYMDDLLIFSETLKEHCRHVRLVLERLQQHGLQCDLAKCEFHVEETTFLGLIVSKEGIRMDPSKVATILEWQTPRTVKDVQAFLGFANFYRRFIKAYSREVKPLTELTRKNIEFTWGTSCQKAFDSLKAAFVTAPILKTFEWNKLCVLEADASDYVSGGVLSQYDEDGTLRPVAYFSKTHSAPECNYEIYDKELMAIVKAFEEWRPELQGSPHPISVLTDHRNLEYFMTKKHLNRRQARWAEFLSQFNFKLTYRPGKLGGKPDALTRRSQDLPQDANDARNQHQEQTILQPEHLEWLNLNCTSIESPEGLEISGNGPLFLRLEEEDTETDPEPSPEPSPDSDSETDGEDEPEGPSLEDLFQQGYEEDPLPNETLARLRTGQRHSPDISLGDCEDREGWLYYRRRRYVPNYEPLQLRLLETYHDRPTAGHPGREKTYSLLSRHYYWPRMTQMVSRYVRNCRLCRRTKYSRTTYQGLLEPLEVPERPWTDISVDFIVKLPESGDNDSIMVVVDRLTKLRHFIPCNETVTAEGAAKLFLTNVWRLHGLPKTIVSDRGPQWVSRFWRRLLFSLKIRQNISTADHAQTDGQTERLNEVLEAYLRAYCAWQQDDWIEWLPLAELALNNQPSATTGVSPFFATYGYNPQLEAQGLEEPPEDNLEQAADAMIERAGRVHEFLREHMAYAQAVYSEAADRRRTPAPSYQPGDQVYLKASNLHRRRPSRKLDDLYRGPFSIKTKLSASVYELELPAWYKIHPVFHVSKLLRYDDRPYANQTDRQSPEAEEADDVYEVREILDSRIHYGQLQYLIWWDGYDREQSNWEAYENIDALRLITAFHQRYPLKPSQER
jgi:hypothetical protein